MFIPGLFTFLYVIPAKVGYSMSQNKNRKLPVEKIEKINKICLIFHLLEIIFHVQIWWEGRTPRSHNIRMKWTSSIAKYLCCLLVDHVTNLGALVLFCYARIAITETRSMHSSRRSTLIGGSPHWLKDSITHQSSCKNTKIRRVHVLDPTINSENRQYCAND